MTAALLSEPLPQSFEQFVEPAQRLDLLFLFLGEVFFCELFQPFGWNFRLQRLLDEIQALKHVAEDPIEFVEIALVLHQRSA